MPPALAPHSSVNRVPVDRVQLLCIRPHSPTKSNQAKPSQAMCSSQLIFPFSWCWLSKKKAIAEPGWSDPTCEDRESLSSHGAMATVNNMSSDGAPLASDNGRMQDVGETSKESPRGLGLARDDGCISLFSWHAACTCRNLLLP
jgi:hypothetical protein